MSLLAQRAMNTLLEQHSYQGNSGQLVIQRNKVQVAFTELRADRNLVRQIFQNVQDLPSEFLGVISVNELRLACQRFMNLTTSIPTAVIELDDNSESEALVESDLGGGGASSSSSANNSISLLSLTRRLGLIPNMEIACIDDSQVADTGNNTMAVDCRSTDSQQLQMVPVPAVVPMKKSLLVSKTYAKGDLLQAEKHELVLHVLNLQKQRSRKAMTLKGLKNYTKRSNRKLEKNQKALDKVLHKEEQSKTDSLFKVFKRGKGLDGRGGRLSLNSIFSIGLRRSCTSIAAADFAAVSMIDLSPQTVLRCELRTAAAICQSMRLFVSAALDACFESHRCGSWSVMAIGIRADATNSSVWRRSKLHVVESTVLFVSDHDSLASGDFLNSISSRRCVLL